MKNFIRLNILLLALVCLHGCGKQDKLSGENPTKPHNILEVSFVLSTCQGIQPSYQTVVWLEKEDGTYFKPLLVSEYLSFGGYDREGVCSTWPGKNQWHDVSEQELDAVTTATPTIGRHVLRFACPEEAIPAGKYQYVVEMHIVESYNIVSRGTITIGDSPDESIAKVTYVPAEHPKAGQAISQVAAKYCP